MLGLFNTIGSLHHTQYPQSKAFRPPTPGYQEPLATSAAQNIEHFVR
jgi:hypothetical protein